MVSGMFSPVQAKAVASLENYPSVDELPENTTISNPFNFFDVANDPNGDGYVSTVAEWDARKEEIQDLVQHYWLGYRWKTPESAVRGLQKVEDEPNTYNYNGFEWFGMTLGGKTLNVGTEFNNLKATLTSEAVVVGTGDTALNFGPADTEEEAIDLAIAAWNAGYSVAYEADPMDWFSSAGVAVMKQKTGDITRDTIPGVTRKKYTNLIEITNEDRLDEESNPVKASFSYTVKMPTDEQKIAAWGSADVQVPFVIDIGGAAAFSADNLNPQGYALVSFDPTAIYPDDSQASDGISRDGVYTALYPYDANSYEYASGALMAWSWGVSQIISAMEQPAEDSSMTLGEAYGLDPTRTVVTGHSRYGKAAMLAAAFDDRISICVPSEPGGSGIQSYVYSVEGKIFNFNTYAKADRVYGKTEVPTVSYGSGNSWFPETAAAFVGKDNKIPFDADEIISLVAPRPFFVVSGIDSHWLGNEGGVASVQAASEVYDYIGSNEIEKNNIAIRCRESDHVFYNRDFCFALAIMDREFKQTGDETLHVQDLFPAGTGISGMSYPAKDYNTVSEFTYHPFEINSSFLPWSSANKYVLWTNQDNFLTNHNVTIVAHSDAPDVDLVLPDGVTKIDATSHNGDEFIFNLTKEQSIYGRYQLVTVGEEKANRSVYFSAISVSDALRHGTTKGDEGEENRVLGFASKLANTKENPPLVYVGGSETPETMSFTGERVVPETTGLMGYGVWFHDNLFARIAEEGWDDTKTFDIKNLQFVTMPGYAFELSFSDIAASAEDNGKKDANLFTKPISWNVERYNNGEADVYPAIPDTLEERQIIDNGGIVVRPIAPAKTVTDFDTSITSITGVSSDSGRKIIITFSEPLNQGEFGFGLDIASKWTTTWTPDGKQVIIKIDKNDVTKDVSEANLIIFRLMDLDGNLISGPIERTVDFGGAGTSAGNAAGNTTGSTPGTTTVVTPTIAPTATPTVEPTVAPTETPTVEKPVITFASYKKTMELGKSYTFKIRTKDLTEDSVITWASTKAGVAVVGKNEGQVAVTVKATTLGKDTIQVKLNGEVVANVSVKVIKGKTPIEISFTNLPDTMYVGETYTVNLSTNNDIVKDFYWKTTKSGKAVVALNRGKLTATIKAKTAGNDVVQIKIGNDVVASQKVVVKAK